MAIPEGLFRSYSGSAVPTALSQPITDSSTSIQVTDGSTFPAASDFRYAAIIIDEGEQNEEVVWYSDRTGHTLNNCIRGGDGTSAFTHGVGAVVKHIPTALDFREANEHVNNPDPEFVPHDQHVHLTVAQEVTANHTFSGNIEHTGATDFTGAVNATGSFHVDTLDVDEIGDVAFTGTITYPSIAGNPSLIKPDSVVAKGTSSAPMASDAQLGLDLKAWYRFQHPAGEIMEFGASGPPSRYDWEAAEWSLCDGGNLVAATYPEYAAKVGTLWGGTADSPKKPDKRGRKSVGVDGTHPIATVGGAYTATLTVTHLPAHNHPVNNPTHVHDPGAAQGFRYVVTSNNPEQHWITSIQQAAGGAGNVQVTFTDSPAGASNVTTSNTGSGQAFSIEDPWIAVPFYIKVH